MKQLSAFRKPLVTPLDDIIDRVHFRVERTCNEGSPQIFVFIIHAPPNKLSVVRRWTIFFPSFLFHRVTHRAILCSKMVTLAYVVFPPRAGMSDRRHALASCQVEKRSPYRYFEMRGKKNPRWELRGMFVGVRGKKWARAPYEDNSPFVRVFDNTERIGVDGDSPATLGNSIN